MQLSHYETMYTSELTHWWYRVRRELIHKLVQKNYGSRTDLQILDVGCGTGALMKELTKYGTIRGVDFSETAVEFCKSRGITNVELGVVDRLNYPDNTFDIVLALDVLEHIEDDQKSIREIHRVLKPGGMVIAFVPTFMFLWSVTDVISQHFRRYTKGELISKMLRDNFKIVHSSYFNTILFTPIALARFAVRIFNIKIKSENNTGNGIVNKLLYHIFHLEIPFVTRFSLPFGVSAMVIAKK